MTDPTHVQFAAVVAAFATLGIDISTQSHTISVVLGTNHITVVRQRRGADGGLVVAGDRIAETRTEIAIQVGNPACTCPDIDVSNPADPYDMATLKGLDPTCPQHRRPPASRPSPHTTQEQQ